MEPKQEADEAGKVPAAEGGDGSVVEVGIDDLAANPSLRPMPFGISIQR
jgi:hypothetical protein